MTLDLLSWKLKRICGCDWEHILLSKLNPVQTADINSCFETTTAPVRMHMDLRNLWWHFYVPGLLLRAAITHIAALLAYLASFSPRNKNSSSSSHRRPLVSVR
jgi:hypothetical protein